MTNSVKGFRLNDDLIESLNVEAKLKKITLNKHVSNILSKHNEVYAHLEESGIICHNPNILLILLEDVKEKTLKKISEIYADDLKKITLSNGWDPENFDEVLQVIKSLSDVQGIMYKHKSDSVTQTHTLIHPFGGNWGRINELSFEILTKKSNAVITEFKNSTNYFKFSHKTIE